MARADGRVQPGQRLDSAFSARAWNRAQDAADIVLAERNNFAAAALMTSTLPSLRAAFRLQDRENFVDDVAVFGHAAIVVPAIGVSASLLPQPTTPVTVSVTESYSDEEKLLPSVADVLCRLTDAQPANGFLNESPIVVCSNPPDTWTYSGLAITRVRVFSARHQFARSPVACGLNDNNAVGCLDSCAYSDVRIIGYFTNGRLLRSFPNTSLVFPNHEYRWALVKL